MKIALDNGRKEGKGPNGVAAVLLCESTCTAIHGSRA